MAAAGLDVSELRKGRKPGHQRLHHPRRGRRPNLVISATGAGEN